MTIMIALATVFTLKLAKSRMVFFCSKVGGGHEEQREKSEVRHQNLEPNEPNNDLNTRENASHCRTCWVVRWICTQVAKKVLLYSQSCSSDFPFQKLPNNQQV
jgi:hypothetical protein